MRLFFLSLLIFLLPLWALADGISNLIKKAGGLKDYPDAQQLVIFDSTRVVVSESGLGLFYMHRLHKVLTAKGALELNVIKIDYDPLTAWAEIQKVVIYRNNGSREEQDIRNVLDYAAPARAIYWGAREKMLGIGRLEPGDAVEVVLFKKGFTYALLQGDDDERYVPPMKGHFYDIIPFWADYPVLEKVYQVSIPVSKHLQYKFYNGDVITSTSNEGDMARFIFTKKDMMPVKTEPGMVDKSDIAPKLLMSTSPDWIAKSLWFNKVNEDFGSFDSSPAIHAKVTEILKGAANENDSISRLTHWCADEIRYSGISMGKGEGFTLHKGDMTFTDRCGVCKDKAGILITMLRDAGFKSYPAMTMAGSRIETMPADQFNHCVTVVKKRDGKYHLLDPTWVPFVRELWSSAEQQQNYLMGIPEGADLAITPVSSPDNHYLKVIGLSEVTGDGTLRGEFTLIAEGQSDAAIRRMFTSGYKAQWKLLVERELLKVNPQAKIIMLNIGDPYNYMAGPIRIQLQYEIPAYAVVTDKEIIFTPLLASEIFKGSMGHLGFNTSLQNRRYPFRDRSSRHVELKETIKLPFNGNLAYTPIVKSVNDTSISYSGSYSLNGSYLVMSQNIVLGKRVYEPADWPAYREVVKNQNRMAEEAVIVKIK